MATMIDWVDAVLPITEVGWVDGGYHRDVNQHGLVREFRKFRSIEGQGSHGATVGVLSTPRGLRVSGNLNKFMHGHNVLGRSDFLALHAEAFQVIIAACYDLGVRCSPSEAAAIECGDYDLKRVDITRSFRVEPPHTPTTWLKLATLSAKTRYQAASHKRGTLYIGQNSRRVAVKIYAKGVELEDHPIPVTVPYRDEWAALAQPLLRCEVVMRQRVLAERGLDRASSWSGPVSDDVMNERLSKLEIADVTRLPDDVANELPGRLLGVYEAWRAGRVISEVYPRASYYRYLAALKRYGVDISRPRPRVVVPETEYALGAPLKSFISGPGVEAPAWAGFRSVS